MSAATSAGAPKVLVTGGTGFLGTWLLHQLASGPDTVAATYRSTPGGAPVTWMRAGCAADLGEAIDRWRPAVVLHCMFPAVERDEGAYLTLVRSVHERIFDAATACDAAIVIVGSSAVYRPVAEPGVLDEDSAIAPVSSYGRAKAAVERLAAVYADARGLRYSVARMFNLIGPGQRRGMLLPDWMMQFAAILDGRHDRLVHVRTLATARDFVDVRDAASALQAMAERAAPGSVINVCSGEAVRLSELLIELQRVSGVVCPVTVDAPQGGATDVAWQRGSFAAAARLGWRPSRPWRESVRDAWTALRMEP